MSAFGAKRTLREEVMTMEDYCADFFTRSGEIAVATIIRLAPRERSLLRNDHIWRQ